jgi:hypothetical protein
MSDLPQPHNSARLTDTLLHLHRTTVGSVLRHAFVPTPDLFDLLDSIEKDVRDARALALGHDPPCDTPNCGHDHMPFG